MQKIYTLVTALLLTAMQQTAVSSESWEERREHIPDYNLHGKKILMVVGHDYDHHEVFDIREMWENWGAVVDVAAAEPVTEGHTISFNGRGFDKETNSEVKTDVQLKDATMEKYDALYFPGGGGPEHLVKEHSSELNRLIDEALQKGVPITAICGGPLALTTHDHFKGMEMTVSPSKIPAMTEYGIQYVTREVVVNDNVITGNWPYFQTFAIAVAHKMISPEATADDIFPASDCELCDLMQSQRPSRQFANLPLEDEAIRNIIRSGVSVPWVRFAQQDWHFVAVSTPEVRGQIKQAMFEYIRENGLHPNTPQEQIQWWWNTMLDHPVLLLGYHSTNPESPSPESINQFMENNIIAVGTQMMLAAHGMGLGAQWLPQLPALNQPTRNVLNLDDNLKLVFAMAVGYADLQELPPVRKPTHKILEIF